MNRFTAPLTLLTMLSLAGCAATSPSSVAPLKPGTEWVASSPQWANEATAVFQLAEDYLAAAAPGQQSWAVVMDLDETVLNNVQFQVTLERSGESYSPESWYDWTQQASATAVPGSKSLIDTVNRLGGHVAFVTNRKDFEQLATENNLADLGIKRSRDFRVLLTRASPHGPNSKQGRFELVKAMLDAQGYPEVKILAYFGDNVGDQPEQPGEFRFFCIDQGAMYGEPCAEIPGPGQ